MTPSEAIMLASVLSCFGQIAELIERVNIIRKQVQAGELDLIIIGYEDCPFSHKAVKYVSQYMEAMHPRYQQNPTGVAIAPYANRTTFLQVTREHIRVLRRCLGHPDFTMPMVFVREEKVGMTFIGGSDRLHAHLTTLLKKASMTHT